MLDDALRLLLLFGGLAVIILLFSFLLAAIDALASDKARNANDDKTPSADQQEHRHPVAAAIETYQKERKSEERRRAEREVVTIKVLTATGGFALIAAGVAMYSAFIFRDQEQRQLRAYVFAKPPAAILDVKSNAVPNGVFDIFNSGLTPAYHSKATAGIDVFKYPLPDDIMINNAPDQKFHMDNIIYPNVPDVGSGLISLNRPIKDDEIAAIKDGTTLRIYLYGTIIYNDAFNARHYSNYCISFFGEGPILRAHWAYCPRHNDAD